MKIGNYRASFINYKNPGIFMITINKGPELPNFSRIIHNKNLALSSKKVKTRLSPLGFVVLDALENLKKNPKIEIYQHIIMPDHLHFILAIKEKLNESLGYLIGRFKRDIFKEAQRRAVIKPGVELVFENGFNDQFLKHNRSLEVLINYVKENPYRLRVRQVNPQFFERGTVNVETVECQTYGNQVLLQNPFIEPVIIHRSYSPEELRRWKERWLYAILNGGVIAGAFISKAEKEIFEYALENDAKIILLSNRSYDQREKPTGKLFAACSRGNLLIISPSELVINESKNDSLTRENCLFLNKLAERISADRKLSGD